MLTRMRRAGPARRFGAGLILLALWLQALTPLAITRAAAAAEGVDALIHAVICGQGAPQDADGSTAADLPGPATACEHCPFCWCTAVAPVPATPVAAARPLRWRPAAWPTPPPAREPRPPRPCGLARAPPRSV